LLIREDAAGTHSLAQSSVDQGEPERKRDGVSASADAQLLVDISQVGLYSCLCDPQFVCDLLAGMPFRDEHQDFALTRAEARAVNLVAKANFSRNHGDSVRCDIGVTAGGSGDRIT
jgi:hypothetical protein